MAAEPYSVRWGVVIVSIVLLLALGIFGVFSVIRNLLNSNDSSSNTTTQTQLTDYNQPGTTLVLETSGPIVAKENHDSYRLIVGRTERVMQIIKGYDGAIVKEQRLDNTEAAFTSFITAQELNGFDSTTGKYTDVSEIGYCAIGNRFVYAVNTSAGQVFRTWNTSCGKVGSSKAQEAVRNLFEVQFPDFSTFTTGLNL